MTKGQRAMAVAKAFPEPAKGGKSGLVAKQDGVTKVTLSQARTLLRLAPVLVNLVLAGTMKMAVRIRDRAIRRAGELLKQIEPQQGARNDLPTSGGRPPEVTRAEIAAQAGMSPHQAKQAIRVANVPAAEFEKQVWSPNLPTVLRAAAERRLADEYDAAQERGEVAGDGRPKSVPDENGLKPATAADIGLSRKDIHEARQIRDAEKAEPVMPLAACEREPCA